MGLVLIATHWGAPAVLLHLSSMWRARAEQRLSWGPQPSLPLYPAQASTVCLSLLSAALVSASLSAHVCRLCSAPLLAAVPSTTRFVMSIAVAPVPTDTSTGVPDSDALALNGLDTS